MLKNLVIVFQIVLLSDITFAETVNFKKSISIEYFLQAKISGLNLNGKGYINWKQNNNNKYELSFITKVPLFGTLLSEKSIGIFNQNGLNPEIFSSKKVNKKEKIIKFNRKKKILTFNDNTPGYVLNGDEQDHISALWQISFLLNKNINSLLKNKEQTLNVISRKGVEQWIFLIHKKENIKTNLGVCECLHLEYVPSEKSDSPKVNIWLSPNINWLPVKLIFSKKNGNKIIQSIKNLNYL
tara:strand:+ start:850 stop:1569 length:720 start_codon:yes stop_codon:yes gene_type:complete